MLQDPFLFFGTIAENVAYGVPHASGASILNAARGARAHEFVLKLPEAYDSLVGERGQSLSGGQRQRIAIARAILVDPRILILDEATSAVDVQTEREIQQALEQRRRGRTTSHCATLEHAPKGRLLVVEGRQSGRAGTHLELLARTANTLACSGAQAATLRSLPRGSFPSLIQRCPCMKLPSVPRFETRRSCWSATATASCGRRSAAVKRA